MIAEFMKTPTGQAVSVALLAMLSSLLMGKTLRRLVLLPLELLSRKTSNTIDDQIIRDAEKDLGLDPLDTNSTNKDQ